MKQVYRLYKIEGLNLRHKTKRKRVNQARAPIPNEVSATNEFWAMDFISD